MIGHRFSLVVDCPAPAELAGFYEKLLALTRVEDSGDYVALESPDGRERVAFQRVGDDRRPAA
ncbi:hypothetical protein GCM10010495_16380 [Kitasatospora herbaricolor]|uniref:VOC family protein n=1 Tax=Kitasatospora herbaricolor TaxID=68217 RepID=UPI00174C802E|nr:VOC family protein [Kitasatospora herbaricolor]MDQ0308096.1 hypothetical protein [Kitasatospora herbaricolor]GGV05355.1 hypothetical protein GCM10010495_16380 [Kitasatospora herbaricolor]